MARPFNQHTIIDVVAEWYRVSPKLIRGEGRSRSIIIARHTAMYLIRELTKLSTAEIGELFERDHSTVLHAISNIEIQLNDAEFFADIEELRVLITKPQQLEVFRNKEHARHP